MNPSINLLTSIHHLAMSSMVDVSVPASLILQARMLKTIAYQVVLDYQ